MFSTSASAGESLYVHTTHSDAPFETILSFCPSKLKDCRKLRFGLLLWLPIVFPTFGFRPRSPSPAAPVGVGTSLSRWNEASVLPAGLKLRPARARSKFRSAPAVRRGHLPRAGRGPLGPLPRHRQCQGQFPARPHPWP